MKNKTVFRLLVTISVLLLLACAGAGSAHASAAGNDGNNAEEQAQPLGNHAVINKTVVNAGEKMILDSEPQGGTAPYEYDYYYRFRGTTDWIKLDKYSGKKTFTRTASRSGYYDLRSVITDSTGESAEKVFNVTVVKATGNKLVNAAKIDKSVIYPGESINITSTVHGGTKPYTFTYTIKEYNGSKQTLAVNKMTDTFTYRPYYPGYYTVTVSAADRENRVAEKTLSFTVAKRTGLPNENLSYLRRNVITAGERLFVSGFSKGGTAPYKYSYYYRLRASDTWIPLSVSDKSSSFSRLFTEAGYYDFLVRTTDYNGVKKDRKLQFAVTKETGRKLENNSVISGSTIEAGSLLRMNASAAGGKAPYRYRYYIKKDGGSWVRMEGYTPKDVYSFRTTDAGNYTARFMIADADNNIVTKDINFRVIRNTGIPGSLNISASSGLIYKGQSVTIAASAAGGTQPYEYSFAYRKYGSGTTQLRSFSGSGSCSVTLDSAGFYSLIVTVKYGNGGTASKELPLDVLSGNRLTTTAGSTAMSGGSWGSSPVMNIAAGTTVQVIGQYGRWFRVYYGGRAMWLYDLALGNYKNYSSIEPGTIDAVADDIIFSQGRSMKPLYDYVQKLGYCSMDNMSYEENVAHIMRYHRGACYQRASLLCYLLDRCGYEIMRVTDGKTRRGPHNWCIVKTPEGWRHIDPTSVLEIGFTYLATDSHMEKGVFWDRNKYPKCQ